MHLHPPVYRLHIELEHTRPPIWRRVEVPASLSLRQLHDVIQCVMGWQDSHMHLFEIGGVHYGFGDNEYDETEVDDSGVILGDVVPAAGSVFSYTYDFGDDWVHRITVESVLRDVAREDVPRLLAGERAGPPEDCGGPGGYEDLLDALADPEDESYDVTLGDLFDPEAYDVDAHDRLLGRFRRTSPSTPGRKAQRKGGSRVRRGGRKPSPAMLRAVEVLALLDAIRDQPPPLPDDIVDIAADLISRFIESRPDEFIRARSDALWLAAAVHAAYMLYPRSLLYPDRPLTLADLAELSGMSSAAISTRSRQLREGVRLAWGSVRVSEAGLTRLPLIRPQSKDR